MAINKLDYSHKETWSEQHLPTIALDLGYVLNQRFINVFKDFRDSTVDKAGVTNLLFLIARKHFGEIEPPLEKIKSRF